jgi:hypothetical protein
MLAIKHKRRRRNPWWVEKRGDKEFSLLYLPNPDAPVECAAEDECLYQSDVECAAEEECLNQSEILYHCNGCGCRYHKECYSRKFGRVEPTHGWYVHFIFLHISNEPHSTSICTQVLPQMHFSYESAR